MPPSSRRSAKIPNCNIGEYCRWCPARPFCPEHTKPLFDLVELEIVPAQLKASVAEIAGQDDPSYGIFLAKAKYLADLAAEYKKHVDEAMHAYLENGGTVPGWRLKLKTKLRQWVNETEAAGWMLSEGFETDEIWQTKLQTFAVVDKVAKRRGVKIPDHFQGGAADRRDDIGAYRRSGAGGRSQGRGAGIAGCAQKDCVTVESLCSMTGPG